ncbi:hypothetical protein B0J14DRAFT_564233 [Halenospora varia]|nr:hypothetical protein B0J14DRAFT_564233 [Halenospora varia]
MADFDMSIWEAPYNHITGMCIHDLLMARTAARSIHGLLVALTLFFLFPFLNILSLFLLTMNPEWIQSDRITRRHGFARQGPPDEIWPETDAFLPGVLEQDALYTPQFEDPSFPPTRPTHQSSGQYGYRGRPASQPYPQNYAAGMGKIQRTGDTWGGPNNQVSRLPNSQSLEEPQEGVRREVANLTRKLVGLQDELAKDCELKEKRCGELEKKWSDLEEQVTRHGNLRDLLIALEEKYKGILRENNKAVAGWIHAAVEGLTEAGTNGELEYKSGTWGEHMGGNDDENQGLLSGMQSNSFDFIK